MMHRNIITEIHTKHTQLCEQNTDCLNIKLVTILLSRVRHHDLNTYTVAARIRHSNEVSIMPRRWREEHHLCQFIAESSFSYVSVVSSLSSAAIAHVVNCFINSDHFEYYLWISHLAKKRTKLQENTEFQPSIICSTNPKASVSSSPTSPYQ